MFKRVFFVLVALLFFASAANAAKLQTFELVGTISNQPHANVVKAVQDTLSKSFKIIATYNPGDLPNATVIILSDPSYYKVVNSVDKNAFFGIPLRVGVLTLKGTTQISFVNPNYVMAAFSKSDKMADAAAKEFNKLLDTLKQTPGIKVEAKLYGYSSSRSVLSSWNMMGKSLYTLITIKKFDSNQKAKEALDKALAANKNGWKKVYEVDLQKAIVIGVSKPSVEKTSFDIGGINHLTAFPIELLIKDGKVIALPEMYRMSLYFMDAGMGAFMAHMSMPGEIDDSLQELLK